MAIRSQSAIRAVEDSREERCWIVDQWFSTFGSWQATRIDCPPGSQNRAFNDHESASSYELMLGLEREKKVMKEREKLQREANEGVNANRRPVLRSIVELDSWEGGSSFPFGRPRTLSEGFKTPSTLYSVEYRVEERGTWMILDSIKSKGTSNGNEGDDEGVFLWNPWGLLSLLSHPLIEVSCANGSGLRYDTVTGNSKTR